MLSLMLSGNDLPFHSIPTTNNFTLYDRAINFTSDGEKLIAVCYSQQKLYSLLIPEWEHCRFWVKVIKHVILVVCVNNSL